MSVARASIDKALITWLLMFGCLLGGLWGFSTIGRLEDPSFSIKTAVIITQYPGASAEEVAREVSEPLESAIQQMAEVDHITSSNKPGVSRITVEVENIHGPDDLPQIWDELRNRVGDARASLPQDANEPQVNDGFGDVYGLFFAVTTPGFTDAERHDLADFLRRELLTVEGVADVTLDGLPDEAIYVEPEPAILTNLGLPPAAIIQAITTANSVTPAGSVSRNGQDIRIEAPVGSDTVQEIQSLTIGVGGEVIDLTDVARVYRDRVAEPGLIVRFDGEEAFTIGVSAKEGLNIVDVGHRVDARLDQLMADTPYGVQLHPIYQQHLVVEEASDAFLLNLAMSVAIVVIVLALFMGWRAAVVVGTTLLLTVVGTVFFMALFGIEMQRISLGALIIAMGMLVDNAIVVAEGMQGDMAQGKSAHDAAGDVADKTQIPLLGATIIGIMAFVGIGLSPDATGEFLFSLFAVIGISLLLSWVLGVTVTPLLGHYFFKRGTGGAGGQYDGPIFRAYAASLRLALRLRWLVVVGLIGLTAVCFVAFGQVKQQFFPDSNTPIFYVHYKLPQGAGIARTADDMAVIENWLEARDDVVSYTTFVGGGASRFMLTYAGEERLPTYGHVIIRTGTIAEIPPLRDDLETFGRQALPQGEFRTERLAFGPGGGTPIAMRFSGPDPDVLRTLANEAQSRLKGASDQLLDIRSDWRERELVLRPVYASERAQTAGITRDNVAQALQTATDGIRAGVYREQDRMIPIVVRTPDAVLEGSGHLINQPVYSEAAQTFIPIEEVIDGFTYDVQDTLIQRRDRLFTITVGAGVPPGVNAASVFQDIRPVIDEMSIPEGYAFVWGGEYEDSAKAQQSLGTKLPLSLLVMVLISVLLFGKLRQPLVIWLLVPMSVNGVVIGLLGSGLPFSFTALLGLLSLSGMLIKNGIVLVEEIDLTRADGVPFTRAVVEASTSRLRPVVLAAATTILGMIPLLWDAFFASMAVTIMGGLGFASILTLVAAPVFYYIVFPGARKLEKAQMA
ncbi:efflux RND transporter permease subunit [Lutimaribacter sp. EGI FJ00015]|uniref:Efflux RND transporter permease subunit n=1 Tax=Lutimaribacter degradans TaxID=2945989 RepID=A0ACC5ZZ96_9RHOB|nr:efflux RND transporter permease subunit [Lutimaribacter sp. EGI FJ00013]MCM2563662.1 efflux RND transporter permease subunit [Lutimaribacter sp. EGI FJ00013]MCO0614802.1 efflux RND transporter permease subunit [Lutimaribacter sp. EGI FJ00015]MCO0637514.1 efflux RND transporter permease subunit [Lutimaribacter sp. EGI FJ00014]